MGRHSPIWHLTKKQIGCFLSAILLIPSVTSILMAQTTTQIGFLCIKLANFLLFPVEYQAKIFLINLVTIDSANRELYYNVQANIGSQIWKLNIDSASPAPNPVFNDSVGIQYEK
jgi:hypothetical protein